MSKEIRLSVRGDPELNVGSDPVIMQRGASDYLALDNKPSIEGHVLEGDKSLAELGITAAALDVTAETLGISAESLGITGETLGITPETLGMEVASNRDILAMFD